MTETGLSLGTPHYMSPEQAMGERTVDARTDIYALGCVLYELLTGEPPFTGPTAQAIVAKVLASEPEPVTTLRRMVPPHITDAVHTAIQKLPADRFKSAADFAAALDGRRIRSSRGVPSVLPSFRRSVAAAWAIAAIGLIAAAAAWLRPRPEQPVTRFSVALPDSQALSLEFNGSRFALSPDGRYLVYRGGERRSRLWLRAFDQLAATPLPGTEDGYNPSFSPDGSLIAFVAGSPRRLMVVDLAGAPPRKMTDSLVDQGGVSWGPDGIYYDGHLEGDGIARIAGGSPEAVSIPDKATGESWHFQPEALPNGRGLVFTVSYNGVLERMSVAVLDLKTRTHRVLGLGMSPRYARCGHLLFVTADGVLMAAPFDQDKLEATGDPVPVAKGLSVRGLGRADLSLSTNGTLAYAAGGVNLGLGELSWVSRTGQTRVIDTAWHMRFGALSLSPDGSRLATSTFDGTVRNIWIKQLDRGPAAKLTFERERNDYPVWSPDGRTILFSSAAENQPADVYAGPADGSTLPTRVLAVDRGVGAAFYAPDGKRLILTIRGDLYTAATEGDTALHELLATGSNEVGGTVSPDGRWLAYVSDESGRFEIYVRPFPDVTKSKRQVSVNGGQAVRWSPDGRELFHVNAARQLVAVPVLPGPAFAVGEERILFATEPFQGNTPFLGYDVHPDGQRFIMSRQLGNLERLDELIVVQGFFKELKGR